MTEKEKAINFCNSIRGKYIISQALCLAVKEINSRPQHAQEPSNVADMEYLIEQLFPLYRVVETGREEFVKQIIRKELEQNLDGSRRSSVPLP